MYVSYRTEDSTNWYHCGEAIEALDELGYMWMPSQKAPECRDKIKVAGCPKVAIWAEMISLDQLVEPGHQISARRQLSYD